MHVDGVSEHEVLTITDLEKEQEVWEAFRDEHFEASSAIEQVPLALHRQCALMNELDQQSNAHVANLSPILASYIKKRRDLAHLHVHTNVHANEESSSSTLTQGTNLKEDRLRHPHSPPSTPNGRTSMRPDSIEPSAMSQETSVLPQMSTLVKPLTTTRQMLVYMAGLREGFCVHQGRNSMWLRLRMIQ
ncbi:hypothetical protein FPV67DRAFT_1443647 [Lyophyllum atratum]|nr:hypothetical protein FPV67DRAFT_1443647 [Lyophyllum atratum]